MNHVALVLPGIEHLAGAERQAILLAKGLARRGWRVSVIGLTGEGGDAARDLEAARVSFVSLRMRKGVFDPRGWVRFHRWIKEHAPDVLHAHLPHGSWMARGVRILTPVRAVVDTIHTSSVGPPWRRVAYRASGWLSDRVTAVSREVAEAYVSAGAVRAEQMTVVPNGVDVDEWAPDEDERQDVREELGLTGEFLWCAAGRLEPVKNYPALLQAFASLPDWAELVIVGAGSQESRLRALASDPAFGNRVRFLGFQANVRRWMRAADGFVLSSLWEGLPVSLLEASACGLPSVATAVSGARDVVVEGETGYLAEPGSIESLARAMHRVMQISPVSRRSMGLDARQRVTEEFSLEAVLDRWEELYCELLGQNPEPERHGAAAVREDRRSVTASPLRP